jgi:MATE family multidrug resistance protein
MKYIGVARGVGWQHLGAYANLAAFYLVGIPVAALLGFCTSLRGEGLWIGILVGAIIQVVLLSVVTICTNYEKQVLPFLHLLSFLFNELSPSNG